MLCLYVLFCVMRNNKKEKMKGKNLPSRSSSQQRKDHFRLSAIPEEFANSQSCDTDFSHKNSPTKMMS